MSFIDTKRVISQVTVKYAQQIKAQIGQRIIQKNAQLLLKTAGQTKQIAGRHILMNTKKELEKRQKEGRP